MTTAVSERQRAGCLSYWLLILIAVNGFALISYLAGGNSIFYLDPNSPAWALYLFIAAFLVNLVAAVGLWNWKKWGLYGFAISFIVTMLAHLIIGWNTITALFIILGIFMLYALLRGRLQWFE